MGRYEQIVESFYRFYLYSFVVLFCVGLCLDLDVSCVYC